MNPILEDIDYPDSGIPAKSVLKSLIYEEDSFSAILGRNEKIPMKNGIDYYLGGHSADVKMYDSRHYMFIEDGIPKGFFALKENNQQYFRKEIAIINLLYVDKEYRRTGVASRILDILQSFADKINIICKTRDKIFKRNINERYFSLCVFPNLFDYLEGYEPDLKEIENGDDNYDFTVEDYDIKEGDGKPIPGDYYMRDETYGEGDFTPVLKQKELRRFYEGKGFVQCDELQFSNPIKDGKVEREVGVSSRTLCNMNKTPLIYPDNRDMLDIMQKHFLLYNNTAINDDVFTKFTSGVIAELDNMLEFNKEGE